MRLGAQSASLCLGVVGCNRPGAVAGVIVRLCWHLCFGVLLASHQLCVCFVQHWTQVWFC